MPASHGRHVDEHRANLTETRPQGEATIMANRIGSFAAGAAFGAILTACVAAIGQTDQAAPPAATPPAPPPRPSASLPELRRITDAFTAVKENFAEEPQDPTLADGCITGMLRKLDPQSAYLDKTEFREMVATSSGTRGGIGL
jgi:C-terminal processing protease CtpA/Prc